MYARCEEPDVFGPFDEEVTEITKKLAGIKPANFTEKLSY